MFAGADSASSTGPSAEAPPTWEPVDVATYRTTLRRLASGVTVVTTRHHGLDHAMTASAFTSVSLRPPLVLVCVEKVARFHRAVLATGVWGVSILAADAADVANRLASRGRSIRGQLHGIEVHRGRTGVPLLGRALAWLECRTWAVHDGGDHSIVVGEVVTAQTRDGTGADGRDPETNSPEANSKINPETDVDGAAGGAADETSGTADLAGSGLEGAVGTAPLVYFQAAYHTVTPLADLIEHD